ADAALPGRLRELAEPARQGLRAAMVLAAAEAVGRSTPAATAAAAAVELVHAFTLVHDDVMDRSDHRHGAPTVWRLWGVDTAILLGDALQACATRLPATALEPRHRAEAVVLLQDTVLELCHGQDLDAREHLDLDAVEPAEVAEAKTGSLMGRAWALGALVADAPLDVVERFERAGRLVGIAFQVADDLLDVWGDVAVTGKHPCLDLLDLRPTFPVVDALRSGTAAGEELRGWLAERRSGRTDDVLAARAMLDRAGSRGRCLLRIETLRDEALAVLDGAPGAEPLRHLVTRALSDPGGPKTSVLPVVAPAG
ncbi:polyprenyl synthetase family protein, partial [Angustibacter aerolatus]